MIGTNRELDAEDYPLIQKYSNRFYSHPMGSMRLLQVGIFYCLPSLPPLIFYFRVIYRANVKKGIRYFPCLAHNIVIYAYNAKGQGKFSKYSG
jgi:hypothetical protein